MIKVNRKKRTVRECLAPFQHEDEETGELKTSDIRVRYFSVSIREIKAIEAAEKAQKAQKGNPEQKWLSDKLAARLESLPDLTDENDKPFPVTADSLEDVELLNLLSIQAAIEEDMDPKRLPRK